jgi:hypothetical protein
MRRAVVLAIVSLSAGPGCNHGEPMPDMSAVAHDMTAPDPVLYCDVTSVGDGGVPATWTNVETIIDNSCNNGMCHYGCRPNLSGTGMDCFTVPGGGVGLDLRHGAAYASLVNQTAPDKANQCGGVLVTPFRPDKSYLMVKLSTPNDPVACGQTIPPEVTGIPSTSMQCNPKGSLMPVTEPFVCPLRNCQIDMIRRWILAGSPP